MVQRNEIFIRMCKSTKNREFNKLLTFFVKESFYFEKCFMKINVLPSLYNIQWETLSRFKRVTVTKLLVFETKKRSSTGT